VVAGKRHLAVALDRDGRRRSSHRPLSP
jgi:hypothetical protein